ncbi:hypothetical protein [Sediminitomix flava]|uniref:Uncharacterized protein n=1 Tax=Sediminitomix flava TaxID=379075 RepID=A0A315Z6M4_SEDFL|nr:hypothetical protein [Sediminitomix flava]PWJ38019.1 hypothetical protein BC781_108154 [Sediminitomix flava]PWJ38021.1 hypothetical protein BC781_108156 [Sediminitomix flava]
MKVLKTISALSAAVVAFTMFSFSASADSSVEYNMDVQEYEAAAELTAKAPVIIGDWVLVKGCECDSK